MNWYTDEELDYYRSLNWKTMGLKDWAGVKCVGWFDEIYKNIKYFTPTLDTNTVIGYTKSTKAGKSATERNKMEPKIRTTTSSLVNEMQLWKWMEGDYLNGEPKFEAHLKKLGLAFDGESVCIGRTNDVAYPARYYWCEDLRTFVHIAFMTVEHSGITEPTGAVPVFVEIFGNQY